MAVNNKLTHLMTSLFICSMFYDKDAGHKTFMEDVYEVQSRMPGGRWLAASRPWTDVVSF